MTQPKKIQYGLDILRYLVGHEGLKIFDADHAREAVGILKLNPSYLNEALHYLERSGWVVRLKRGLYMTCTESGIGQTPHDYEIAMALVSPSAISHWTAMHYYQLTQQTPNIIFAITPVKKSIPSSLDTNKFHYIRIKPERFFGIDKVWVDGAQICITDIERTLLDGIMMPRYCGDFQEVLYAFKRAYNHLSVEKIVEYALRLNKSTIKRLGWILDHLGYDDVALNDLLIAPVTGYHNLDPTGPSSGKHNKKWMIRENL